MQFELPAPTWGAAEFFKLRKTRVPSETILTSFADRNRHRHELSSASVTSYGPYSQSAHPNSPAIPYTSSEAPPTAHPMVHTELAPMTPSPVRPAPPQADATLGIMQAHPVDLAAGISGFHDPYGALESDGESVGVADVPFSPSQTLKVDGGEMTVNVIDRQADVRGGKKKMKKKGKKKAAKPLRARTPVVGARPRTPGMRTRTPGLRSVRRRSVAK